MAGNLVTIATFDLPPKARLAQNILEKAGIKAVVTDETVVAMDWLLGNAVGWVKVQVLEEDAERAVTALEESLGGGEDALEEEALAAEAEAAPREDVEDSLPPAVRRDVIVPVSAASGARYDEFLLRADDGEPELSERDQYARRLYLTAVFSVAVPPLWFYAIYLFLNAAFGEGPLSERGRSHLIRGGLIMAAGLVFLLVLVQSFRVLFEWD
jgi:hypothetical protein